MAKVKCMFFGHKLELEEIYRRHIKCSVCAQRWDSTNGRDVMLIHGMYQTMSSRSLPEKEFNKFWYEYNFDELVAKGDVESLKLKLRKGNLFVSRRSATALGRLHNIQATDALLEFLGNEEKDQVAIVHSLGQIGDSKIVEPLLSILSSTKKVMLQEKIITVLTQFNDQSIINALIERAKGSQRLDTETIRALSSMKGDLSSVTVLLIKRLLICDAHLEFTTGKLIVNALIHIHDPNSIEPLKEIFKNGKDEVIKKAIANA